MSERNFRAMLEHKWSEGKFVCVGLDSDIWKIPVTHLPGYHKYWEPKTIIFSFNQEIVKVTKDLVCAHKPNSAFYESLGNHGMIALYDTIRYINEVAPDVPVILDAKRADIDNTNEGYVKYAFSFMDADAITVHPYLGAQALKPLLEQKNKGIIVLCRTSNKGAGEFQDAEIILSVEEEKRWGLGIGDNLEAATIKLYEYVAYRVVHEWNKNGNCAVVVGATCPEELKEVRKIVGDMPILIPGIGTQGGDLEKTVLAGKDSRGRGMIINSSRGIIFASSGQDFAEAARHETEKLHYSIHQILKGDPHVN